MFDGAARITAQAARILLDFLRLLSDGIARITDSLAEVYVANSVAGTFGEAACLFAEVGLLNRLAQLLRLALNCLARLFGAIFDFERGKQALSPLAQGGGLLARLALILAEVNIVNQVGKVVADVADLTGGFLDFTIGSNIVDGVADALACLSNNGSGGIAGGTEGVTNASTHGIEQVGRFTGKLTSAITDFAAQFGGPLCGFLRKPRVRFSASLPSSAARLPASLLNSPA